MKDVQEAMLLFSKILDYPTNTLEEDLKTCEHKLEKYEPACVKSLQNFSTQTQQIPLSHLQELYTQHIDFNPSCSLYVGYHLFGDSYKRSKFLVKLRTLYQQANFVEKGNELPDALPVILHFFGEHSYDCEDCRLIIKESLLPCLKKLMRSYKKAQNIYREIIQALYDLLQKINLEKGVVFNE